MINYYFCDKEKADSFSSFIPEDIRKSKYKDRYWYIIATQDTLGILGMIIIDPVESHPQILSLGVSEYAQNMGFGTELVRRAIGVLREAGAEVVSAYVPGGNAAVQSILENFGFDESDDEAKLYSFKLKAVAESPIFRKAGKASESVKNIESISPVILRHFYAHLNEKGIMLSASEIPCDEKYSYIIPGNDEIPVYGALLCDTAPGKVRINYAYVDAKAPSKMYLPVMLTKLFLDVSENFDRDTEICVTSVNEISDRIISSFIGDKAAEYTVKEYMKLL